MNKRSLSVSRKTVLRVFSSFLVFVPFVIFHFFPVNPMFDNIVIWGCVGIGLAIGYKGGIFHVPAESVPDLLNLHIVLRILLVVASLLTPVIAGRFLPFDYLIAFIVASVSMFMLMAAFWSWLDKSKVLGDVLMVLFVLFSYISFGYFSGDLMGR